MTNFEIDQLIYEKVLGITWDETRCRICGLKLREEEINLPVCTTDPAPLVRADAIPPYSSDISCAWRVIDKLRERYTNIALHAANGWGLSLGSIGYDGTREDSQLVETWLPPINADTAPMAICLAALAACGVSVGEEEKR